MGEETMTHHAMRGFFLRLLFLGLAILGTARYCAAGQPNILFLLADDQRPDSVAAFDNPNIYTPALDRLVKGGFAFRRNYCMGSIHGAVCQPSRAMLNSGRSLYRVKMNLDGSLLLPEWLGQNGYTTFGTGKWHNGPESFLRGFQKGSAVFFGGMSNHLAVPLRDINESHELTPRRTGEGFSSEIFTDSVIRFLREHDRSKPFYAYVAFTAPHDPRMPPIEYRENYYSCLPPLPDNFMPEHPFNNGWMTGRDEALAPWPRTPWVVRNQIAEYYGLISHMDQQIDRIMKVLDELGYADNTIVVYTADHGLALGSHGLLGKQNLYEQSMGCPLFFRGPGIPQGVQTDAFSYLYDLFPTLCSLAGVPVPGGLDGKSLAPVIRGEAKLVREDLFTTYEDLMRSVRDDRWKLIRYPKINYTQLFDLASDPGEMNNLAEDPAFAGRVRDMMARLEEWQQWADDKAPLSTDNPIPMEIDLSKVVRKPDAHQPQWIIDKYFSE
jgi:arylsulfatase A-like enzyme